MKYAEGIKKIKSAEQTVTGFCGIDRSEKAKSGALYEGYNIKLDGASVKPRGRRAIIRTLGSGDGLFGDDTLAYVDSGRLYYGALEVSGLMLSGGDKTVLKVGRYLLIFPDEVYYDTASGEYGAMSVSFSSESARLCCVDGELNEISYTEVEKEPDDAAVGSYCAIRDKNGALTVKRYDGNVWNVCQTYTKLASSGIGSGFRAGDAVECSGVSELGDSFCVVAATENALYCEGTVVSEKALGRVKVSRTVPIFDFCTESGGRLCGVRRGRDKSGNLVSRIYVSAQNDPFNFSGLVGGAYADVDVSGAFTGVCDYLGQPVAFSEGDIVEARLKSGELLTTVIKSYGIETGASRSAVSFGGVLYYKSSVGVCAYDGSYPEIVSGALCDRLHAADYGSPAICTCGKYRIKLTNTKSETAIYVYNIDKNTWTLEDDPGVKAFAKRRENAYALTDKGELILLDSETADSDELTYCSGAGYPTVEGDFDWHFESREIGADSFSSVCPVRLAVRLNKAADSAVKICVSYDGNRTDETLIERGVYGAMGVPIPLKRADTFKIRISGKGECEIKGYSVEWRVGGASKWR